MGKAKRIKQQKAEKAAKERQAYLLSVDRLVENARPSLATITTFIKAGAAKGRVSPDGDLLEAEVDPDKAWKIDPWFWEPIGVGQKEIDGHAKLGTDPPLLYFVNRDYQVAVFIERGGGEWPDMWHLSLKRRDREPIDQDRWRTFQKIKNTLLGEKHEAVELYPSEDRLVDTANQYHLWALIDPDLRFPFGFQSRLVADNPTYGAKQRSFAETPDDLSNGLVEEKMAEFHNAGLYENQGD